MNVACWIENRPYPHPQAVLVDLFKGCDKGGTSLSHRDEAQRQIGNSDVGQGSNVVALLDGCLVVC